MAHLCSFSSHRNSYVDRRKSKKKERYRLIKSFRWLRFNPLKLIWI
jgi:hypothetical protein